jgi:hypothetical protein
MKIWRNGELHAPAALPPVQDKDLGGTQSRSGRCGVEENLALTRNRTPAVQPVARLYTD